ncbi:HIT family protein [archaeon]|nr:MAG: HIT family protein [archaeon]
MEDCIFCKIVSKEIAANVIYEDTNTIAFLDLNPRNPGHTLVITKQHYATIFEIPEEIIADVYRTVKKISKPLKETVNADGMNTVQSNIVSQGVHHFHTHVIPRFWDDNMPIVWESHHAADRVELMAIAEKVKRLLG